jgi:hypothetical protein
MWIEPKFKCIRRYDSPHHRCWQSPERECQTRAKVIRQFGDGSYLVVTPRTGAFRYEKWEVTEVP